MNVRPSPDDACWSCGGEWATFCHGEPAQMDAMDTQMDTLEELANCLTTPRTHAPGPIGAPA